MLSLHLFLAVLGEREQVTKTSCSIYAGAGLEGCGGEQSLVGRLGLAVACGFAEDCSGMSRPTALALSCTISHRA